jgi:hypothetical protein
MLHQRQTRIQSGAFLATGILIGKRCVAWNEKTCFAFHAARHATKSKRSTPILSADSNKEDANDLQSLLNRGDPSDSAGLSSLFEDMPAGVLLDSESYLQADSYLQQDGTLNFDGNYNKWEQKRNNPLYQSAADALLSTSSQTLEDDQSELGAEASRQRQLTDDELLFQAVGNIENNSHRIDPEELHQQVFAEEQTYLEQSEEFRKSLSTLYNDEAESPMAKARREAIDAYNDEILEKLLAEIDEIEKLALTKEEALKQAASQSSGLEFCNRCGCKVTPDVIERIERTKGGFSENSSQKVLCDACYMEKFRTFDEARLRLGVGNYGEGSFAKMYDEKKYKTRTRNDDRVKRRYTQDGIDTSPLFQMPKETRVTEIDIETAKLELESRSDYTDTLQRSRPRTQQLGSRELTRRMERQQKSELTRIVEEQVESEKYVTRKKEVRSDAVARNEEWTRVTDEKSNKTFFWNKATGEMRKNPPES